MPEALPFAPPCCSAVADEDEEDDAWAMEPDCTAVAAMMRVEGQWRFGGDVRIKTQEDERRCESGGGWREQRGLRGHNHVAQPQRCKPRERRSGQASRARRVSSPSTTGRAATNTRGETQRCSLTLFVIQSTSSVMSGRPLGRRSLGAPSSSSSSDGAKTAPISRIPKRAHSIAPSDLKPKAGSTAAAAAAANNVLRDRENQTQPITSSTRPAVSIGSYNERGS